MDLTCKPGSFRTTPYHALFTASSHVSHQNLTKANPNSTMSDINPETGESTQVRSPRFTIWAAFLLFSTITMISAVQLYNSNYQSTESALSNQRWAIACSAITFGIGVIVVGMQLHPVGATLIVGTRIEGIIILILLAFWAATVSIVSDTRNGLAVDPYSGSVTNGNLYYFSWAGFVCTVMLVVSYLRGVFGVDVAAEIKNRSARLTLWSALLAAQLVVLGASANIFDSDCSKAEKGKEGFCSRTILGISVGAIGVAFSLVIVGMKIATSAASFIVEAGIAFLLTILNAFGVGYVTSPGGPGAALGNLYYFTWISLICAAMLLSSCFESYRSGGTHSPGTEMSTTNGAGRQNNENEFPIETLDDNI